MGVLKELKEELINEGQYPRLYEGSVYTYYKVVDVSNLNNGWCLAVFEGPNGELVGFDYMLSDEDEQDNLYPWTGGMSDFEIYPVVREMVITPMYFLARS